MSYADVANIYAAFCRPPDALLYSLIRMTDKQYYSCKLYFTVCMVSASNGICSFSTVYELPSGNTPTYLADECQLISDVSTRRLHSTDTAMCVVRRSHNTFGDRCFTTAGPRLWNSLPSKLRQCDTLGQFTRLLKTHLFRGHGTL